jgi:hypothetical protein
MSKHFGGYRDDTLQKWRENALNSGRITQNDDELITKYVREISAKRGISTARRHLTTKTLIRWRDWVLRFYFRGVSNYHTTGDRPLNQRYTPPVISHRVAITVGRPVS